MTRNARKSCGGWNNNSFASLRLFSPTRTPTLSSCSMRLSVRRCSAGVCRPTPPKRRSKRPPRHRRPNPLLRRRKLRGSFSTTMPPPPDEAGEQFRLRFDVETLDERITMRAELAALREDPSVFSVTPTADAHLGFYEVTLHAESEGTPLVRRLRDRYGPHPPVF